MSTHANRVKMTVTSVASSGTGDITLNAASTGFRSFATAYGANATVDILITEGTAWEIARNCTYTHSGTTLNRGTLENSSTGSAVAFTSAAVVSVIAPASFGNAAETVLGSFGALDGENSITGTATAVIGRLNVCSGTSANYTVTLPAVSGNAGKYIGFRMAPGLTKLVTLDGNSTETIDGDTTRVMWAGETALLYCDGSTWTKMAGKSLTFAAEMKRNSAQAIGDSSVDIIDFNAVEYDLSGLFASLSNNRFDCPRSGLYLINVSWYPAAELTVGQITHSRIHAGTAGSTTERKTNVIAAVAGGLYPMNIVTSTLKLAKDEVIEFHVYTNKTGGVNTASSNDAVMARMTVIEVPLW